MAKAANEAEAEAEAAEAAAEAAVETYAFAAFLNARLPDVIINMVAGFCGQEIPRPVDLDKRLSVALARRDESRCVALARRDENLRYALLLQTPRPAPNPPS